MTPLWDQIAALLRDRPVVDPSHPLGRYRPQWQIASFPTSWTRAARCRRVTVCLDAGYGLQATRELLEAANCTGEIAYKADKAPVEVGARLCVERTKAWHKAFNRLQRCYER
ncbi:hypothetical protein [Micromonospora aurantiaca (nom. illeg.)]|uniref:hypothetical protein n=1 Tax=Micromonospora aurantiaca (nom. illeg.) TaxID=47850 RepID=UPI0037B97C1A